MKHRTNKHYHNFKLFTEHGTDKHYYNFKLRVIMKYPNSNYVLLDLTSQDIWVHR